MLTITIKSQKIKSHTQIQTNSDKFLKMAKNHNDNTPFCRKFVKICQIYPKPQLQHFSQSKTVQKLVKLSKITNPEFVSAKENLNLNQLQEVTKAHGSKLHSRIRPVFTIPSVSGSVD